MPQSIYTKLTRRHRTVLGYTQLWLAADHLLLLTSSRFAEQYQRFAFTDIQAIVVTQRPPQVVLQVVQQIRKGYKFRERLLRPAAVTVAKKPAAE